MNHTDYDAIAIGGGPAGSTLATLLAKQGYRVLLLEREKFPRFHIGESLLPASQLIWEKLGIAESLKHLGHKYKDGAELKVGQSTHSLEYDSAHVYFTEPNNWPKKDFPEDPSTYQVERSQFDMFLLDNAREQGVTVCEEATVREVIWQGDKATGVRWQTKEGIEYTTAAKCIADCSGRQAFMARNSKGIVLDKAIQTSAVFGHFKGVTPNPGKEQGSIVVDFIENGWLWFIPLKSGIMSVGVVMNQPGNSWWSKKSPEEILLTYINRYQGLRSRFASAEQVSKVRILRNLSYASQKTVGNGWLLVGDANFFVDPLLSSGVQVGFKTAEKAAIAINGFLQNNDLRYFKEYERWCNNYKFHVLVTMRLFYRTMKYQFAIATFIKAIDRSVKGKPNRLEQGFIAWAAGNFDRFYGSVYFIWAVFWILSSIGKIRQVLLAKPAWETHTEFCSEPPLIIPKSIEIEENVGVAVRNYLAHPFLQISPTA
jgi:FAD-dependent halogenase